MRLNGSRIVALSRQGGEYPDPVTRYLSTAVLRPRRILAATIEQKGEMRLGSARSPWRSFNATEIFTTGRPRFEWDARIRLGPLVNLDVRDAYIIGAGVTRVSLFGVPLVVQHGKRELNEGALQRYLAEAVWFPTALISGPALSWEVVNRSNAVASIRDRQTSASLMFRFTAAGEVSDILSPGRYRASGDEFVLTPWAVRCREYFDIDGVRIPRCCEAEWLLPDGPLTYWRAEVTRVRYQFDASARDRTRPSRRDRESMPPSRFFHAPAITDAGRTARM